MTKLYEHLCREHVKAVARSVAKEDGWLISNAKTGFFKAIAETLSPDPSTLEEMQSEFCSILKTKWHIDCFDIEGEEELVIFALDSYGESHIERIKKKAIEIIKEYRDESDESGDLEQDFKPVIATPDKVLSILRRISDSD